MFEVNINGFFATSFSASLCQIFCVLNLVYSLVTNAQNINTMLFVGVGRWGFVLVCSFVDVLKTFST